MTARPAMTEAPARLGPDDVGRAVSAEEFAHAELVGPWKYERVAGRLVVMSPDSPEHDAVSEPLRDLLGAYRLANRHVVERVVSEAWVRIPGGTDRIGDIGVYLVEGASDVPRPDRAPELMFEVVSEGKASADRDYREKRLDYHRLGVLEYVILDRFAGRVTVLRYDRDGYREHVVPRSGTYESPLLPGLAIPIAELLP